MTLEQQMIVDRINAASDKSLIAELKRRGYKVAKADRIRVASVVISAYVEALINKNTDYLDNVRYQLGASLGRFLIDHGAVPIIEEIGDADYRRNFRASITVVVDNPEFDWPYPLRMNAHT